MDYRCDRNFCQEEDKTIQRHNTALTGEIERLRGDAKIAKLHDKAVAWRHDSFAKAMKDEEYRALMGRLLITPPPHNPCPHDLPRNCAKNLRIAAKLAF